MADRRTPLLSTLILVYLSLLCAYGKRLSYLHLEVGGLPLFIGELALAIGAIYCAMALRKPRLRSQFVAALPVWVPLAVYLIWSMFKLGQSLLELRSIYGTIQILRDSAVSYQAFWVVIGFMLTLAVRERLLRAVLLTLFASQLLRWLGALIVVLMPSTAEFFTKLLPGANEAVTPLFPLAFGLWSERVATALTLTYGTVFLDLIFYFKRTWVLSAFGIVAPAALLRDLRTLSLPKRIAVFLAGISCATALGIGSHSLAAYLAGSLNSSSRGTSLNSIVESIRTSAKDPEWWLYHGEVVRNAEGQVETRMGWRLFLWRQTWEGIQQAPLTGNGYGPRMFRTLLNGSEAIQQGRWISGPHNSYLTVWFRTGLVGLLAVVLVSLAAAHQCIRNHAFRDPLSNLLLASWLSVAFFTFFNVSLENPQSGTWYWLFLGAWAGRNTQISID
jgi:hypothetical protein